MNYERAHIFGGLGTAILEEDEQLLLLDPSLGSEGQPCTHGDLKAFQEIDPAYCEVSSGLSSGELLTLISHEKQKSDSLFFMLASLDVALENETRKSAAELADGLFENQDCLDYCRGVLLSKPLPEGWSGDSFERSDLRLWTTMVSEIEANQFSLSIIWQSWKELEQGEFVLAADGQLQSLLENLISTMTIRRFSLAISKGDLSEFNNVLVNFSTTPATIKRYPSASRVLTKLRLALERKHAFAKKSLDVHAAQVEREEEANYADDDELSNRQIFEQVKKQQEGIKKLLFTGNFASVDRAVADLLKFHEAYGNQTHLAKTLCSLTKIALEANEPHLAEFLVNKAVSLDLDDIVVYTSQAEVSKSLGRFAQAAEMYEKVLKRFGDQRYALCGYADTLQDQGKFIAAEAFYKKSITLYPDDPVAFNGLVGVALAKGHASLGLRMARRNITMFGDSASRVIYGNLLRDAGRYAESIKELDLALKRFPAEIRIWQGLIKSLAVAGKFPEALARCDEAFERFPDHPMPYLSKGEVLRIQGELKKSLTVYSAALKVFSSHRPAQIGKAAVLTLLDREQEASNILVDLELDSEIDWFAYHTLCIATLKAGKIDTAIEKLEYGIKNVPWQRTKTFFTEALGYAMLRSGKASKAVTYFRSTIDKATHTQRSGILLFLSRSYTDLGQPQKASEMLEMSKPTARAGQELKAALTANVGRIGAEVLRFPSAKMEANCLNLLLAA